MYFCLNCFAGKEEKVREAAEKCIETAGAGDFQVWFPLKQNREKRNGVFEMKDRPLFPGYLFIWWDGTDETVFPFREVQSINGAVRFLRYESGSRALMGTDLAYAEWIHLNRGVIRESKVRLREGQRLQIVEGPLKGFDGNVTKVDKHGRRIKVRFDLGGLISEVSFSVEFLESHSKKIIEV